LRFRLGLVHNPGMADPAILETLSQRLSIAVDEALALPRPALEGGLGPGESGLARPFRPCFEALVSVYLDYCDTERDAWLAIEAEARLGLGARALLPLAQAILAKAPPGDLPEDLSLEEACLSIWALLDGSLRKAVAEDPSPATARTHHIAAARALEYMVGGLACPVQA